MIVGKSFDSLNTFWFGTVAVKVLNTKKIRVYFSFKRLKLLSFRFRSKKDACACMATVSPNWNSNFCLIPCINTHTHSHNSSTRGYWIFHQMEFFSRWAAASAKERERVCVLFGIKSIKRYQLFKRSLIITENDGAFRWYDNKSTREPTQKYSFYNDLR